jgi:hypothetical protein
MSPKGKIPLLKIKEKVRRIIFISGCYNFKGEGENKAYIKGMIH